MITDRDVTEEVLNALGTDASAYDVPAIVDALREQFGPFGVTDKLDVDHDDFWKIVWNHPIESDIDDDGVADRPGPATPELEKQSAAIKDGAHRIGEFLDWLAGQGYHLGRYNESGRAYDAGPQFADLIAGFYEIDLDKIEQERRAILEYLREQQRDDG